MSASRAPVSPGTDTTLRPEQFNNYQSFLQAVRLNKGMRLVDVQRASAHPDNPEAFAKLPSLSRMEKGGAKEPSFRQMCKYSRGYGVPLAKLEYFFRGEPISSRDKA